MYHFTTELNLNNWLSGKTFENQVLRRNEVLDSLGDTGNENDTNSNSYFERRIPNMQGGFDKVIENSKRVSAGGAVLWEHCDITTRCGPSKGGSKTIAGWHRSLGWINNLTTQLNHYGVGWNSWCTNKNFKGKRTHWYFIANAKVYLMDSDFNDNIESVY